MKFGIKFAIVTGLQVLCLVGMIGYKYRSLSSGTEVVLEVPRPVDPRSLFSGDYVIIRYAINDMSLQEISNDTFNLDYGSQVYVQLEQAGDVWKPVRISTGKPGEGKIFLKGKITNHTAGAKPDTAGRIEVEYGIEHYFVQESTGRAMEIKLREVHKARVHVDPEGHGQVMGIPDK